MILHFLKNWEKNLSLLHFKRFRGGGEGAGSPGFATVNIVTITPYLSKYFFEFLHNST